MSFEAWIIFAVFWTLFVTTPGPNAANVISVAMTQGFRSGLLCVAAILTQATAFLLLSAAGVTALIAASPGAFLALKIGGAGLLIYLGVRAWRRAVDPIPSDTRTGAIYARALVIAVVNPKSVAGYLAAFSQFVQTDISIAAQLWVILPTALSLTAMSYIAYAALGAGLGRAALDAIATLWVRRGLAACFVVYGVLLGASSFDARPAR